jgi:acyl carrier protein
MSTPTPTPVQEPLTLARLESILLSADLIAPDQPIKAEDTLFAAGMDSLDLVEAFIELELELGADIDDEALNLTTGDTFAEFIRRVNAYLSGQLTAPAPTEHGKPTPLSQKTPLSTEAQTCRLLWFIGGAFLGMVSTQIMLAVLLTSFNPKPNTNPPQDSWTPRSTPLQNPPKTSGNTWASTSPTLLKPRPIKREATSMPWVKKVVLSNSTAGLSMAHRPSLLPVASSPLLKAIPIVSTLPAPSPEAGKSGSISLSLPSKADLLADPLALALGGTLAGFCLFIVLGLAFK